MVRLVDRALSGASIEYTFPPLGGSRGAERVAAFELVVDAKLGAATIQRTVREEVLVRPWGLEESVAKSGVLSSEETLELALPEGSSWRERELELALGANVERLLLDEALGGGARAELRHIPVSDTIADTSALLIGDLAVLEALGRTGKSVIAEARAARTGERARLAPDRESGANGARARQVAKARRSDRHGSRDARARDRARLGLAVPPDP